MQWLGLEWGRQTATKKGRPGNETMQTMALHMQHQVVTRWWEGLAIATRWWEGLVTRMCNISLAVTFIVNNTREIITSTLIPHSLYVHTAVGYPSFTAH